MKKEIFFDEVFDAQEQFRNILEAMSRPGLIQKINNFEFIPPVTIHKASAIIAFSLLNADVSFAVINDDQKITEAYIKLNTNATVATIDKADYIFINGNNSGDFLWDVKQGNLSYPEDSATVIIDVATIHLSPNKNSVALICKGPGVATENIVYISGLEITLLEKVKELNQEYPLGIDVMIVDVNNCLIGLPRSNHFEFNKNI
jgi:alpha-D-ribose 1-methylphosphonate 5-triphosphate synthase subunit PhnH